MYSKVILFLLIQTILTESGKAKGKRVKETLNSLEGFSEDYMFSMYKVLHGKNYKKDSNDNLEKFHNFERSHDLVKRANSKDSNLKLTLNKFADKTIEEYKKEYLFDYTSFEKDATSWESEFSNKTNTGRFLQEAHSTFTHLDWSVFVRNEYDQEDCGSCWAFATKAAIEINHYIRYGESIELSAQQMVDCDSSNLGCDGGSPRNALNNIMRGGITLNSNYPYEAIQNSCTANSIPNNFVLEAFEMCAPGSCTREYVIELLSKGPVISTLDANTYEFMLYDEGMLDYECVSRNHAIVIVGYYNDGIEEYFKGVNSYGSDWGEGGFFKINVKNRDACFLDYYAIFPKIMKITDERPKPCINFYPLVGFEGTAFEICNNSNNLVYSGQVISFSNPTFQTITLYTGKGCSGAAITLNSDNSNLSIRYPTIVNNINSIVFVNYDPVPSGYVRLYDQSCFTGSYVDLEFDVQDLSSLNFALKTSSIKMNKLGFSSVILYNGINFSGTSVTLSASRALLTISFDKRVQSLKFIR